LSSLLKAELDRRTGQPKTVIYRINAGVLTKDHWFYGDPGGRITAEGCHFIDYAMFLLGARPTIADFGMMAPMFRHFGQDPTPSEIMRTHAPRVFAWVARMWSLDAAAMAGELIARIDAPLRRFLAEIGATHLAQLAQNAAAFTEGRARYDLGVQGATYRKVPTSRYRVWCLENLRSAWADLPGDAAAALREILAAHGGAVLWDAGDIRPSGYDPEGKAPFNRAINVFPGAIPGRGTVR
jgi:predicted dehydrogenase